MTTVSQKSTPTADTFQTGRVLTIAGGHLTHDIFTSFLAPLLPLIIKKLELSLTLAGSLAAFQQLPSLVNPLLGLLADRVSLRWFAVLAPTVTAVAMSAMGLTPNYTALVILLLVAGVSTALWHVPAPVMIARASGRQVGQGMSFFMLGGELARTIGPLLAVSAVAWWGLDGIWRLVPAAMVASVILYWRTREIGPARPATRANGSWAETWRELRRVMLPITGIIAARGFMVAALTTFLPTFLASEGASLQQAGGSLSILELAGAAGVLTSGTVSDRLGRRRVLAFILSFAPALMLAFLAVRGWAMVPLLMAMGFITLSTNPVLMALVQEYGHRHPATANGLYMALQFAGQSLNIVLLGAMADAWGLRAAYQLCALIGFAGAGFALLLPRRASDK